jgi:hypothetical protein
MRRHINAIKGFIWYNLGLLEIIFYWKTKKFLKKHYTNNNGTSTLNTKTIIYMLDGRAYSGGITDIIRGIVSMYKLSKEIGYDFKINFCYPYELTNYLEPNKYNWRISSDEISYNLYNSVPLWLYSVHNNYGKSREYEVEYQRRILKRFVEKNRSCSQLHIYTNSDWTQSYEYSVLFNELFKPAKRLLDAINFHKSHLANNYVSMTFRFQQLLGDFVKNHTGTDKTMRVIDMLRESDPRRLHEIPEHGIIQLRALLGDFRSKNISVPMSEVDSNNLIDCCISKVIEINSEFSQAQKVLITADSEKFLVRVGQLGFVYAITSNNDNDSSDLYNIFLKAYVDMFMISGAKQIYLLTTGPMYKSGFAKNASLISNNPYREVNW